MSWANSLINLYDTVIDNQQHIPESGRLAYLFHAPQTAHLNITLDSDGCFVSALILNKIVLMQTTPESEIRTSNPEASPLHEKLKYLIKTPSKWIKSKNSKKDENEQQYYSRYITLLKHWCESPHTHEDISVVLKYVLKDQVIPDLLKSNWLILDENEKLVTDSKKDKGKFPENHKSLDLLSVLKGDFLGLQVAWSVERSGRSNNNLWQNQDIQLRWQSYMLDFIQREYPRGFCYLTGEKNVPILLKHPKKIFSSSDASKLFTSNDSENFTYLGRFLNSEEACTISVVASLKMHTALRWLVSNKNRRVFFGDRCYVMWNNNNVEKELPLPFEDIINLDDDLEFQFPENITGSQIKDLGEFDASIIKKKLNGLLADHSSESTLYFLVMDSVSNGRKAVLEFQELRTSDYIRSLQKWHDDFGWNISFISHKSGETKKDNYLVFHKLICAPSPYAISHLALLNNLDADKVEKSKQQFKNMVDEIIKVVRNPQLNISKNTLNAVVRQVCKKQTYNNNHKAKWQGHLEIACALTKGYYKRHININMRRELDMALDLNNLSRDYLYGRLLAVAQNIEEFCLMKQDSSRATTVDRLFQQFSDKPFSTWRTISMNLQPYKVRLKSSAKNYLKSREKLISEILDSFDPSDFKSNQPLSAEFLLGYYSQTKQFFATKTENEGEM